MAERNREVDDELQRQDKILGMWERWITGELDYLYTYKTYLALNVMPVFNLLSYIISIELLPFK